MSQRTSITVENRHEGSANFGDAKGIKSEIPLIYIKFVVDFHYFM